MFIRNVCQYFCTGHNITFQMVIDGHLQSLGATERRHRYLSGIAEKLMGNKKPHNAPSRDWLGYAPTRMSNLYPHLPQYGGFTTGGALPGDQVRFRLAQFRIRILAISRPR